MTHRDWTIGQLQDIEVRIDWTRPEVPVQYRFLDDPLNLTAWKKWVDSPYQGNAFTDLRDACETINDWLNSQ